MPFIMSIHAREVIDSCGAPAVEVDVVLSDRSSGRASVSSSNAKSARAACVLRDGDSRRYLGEGVLRAVANIHETLSIVEGMDATDQAALDKRLCLLDGTPNKERIGANAILATSFAAARAAARSAGQPLYRHLGDTAAKRLPVPVFNMVSGGALAENSLDFQQFMVAPMAAPSFREALRTGVEIRRALRSVLRSKGHVTSVAEDGAFAPALSANVQAVELILQAAETAGFTPGKDVALALCASASDFREAGGYVFRHSDGSHKTSEEMVAFWADWVRQFPIWSIEDGLANDDWIGWQLLTARLGREVQLVCTDLFATNPAFIGQGISERIGHATGIEPIQIGTLTEALAAVTVSAQAGYGIVVSNRGGGTCDDFIADLAVAVGAGQIRAGACHGEQVSKYNRLLRIEEELGPDASYAGTEAFGRGA